MQFRLWLKKVWQSVCQAPRRLRKYGWQALARPLRLRKRAAGPRGQTIMAVAGSRVSACDPLPFLFIALLALDTTLHNTLYLSSTASPSSLLSSRPPRQHRRRWSPSRCAGRVARAIREVKPRPARAPTRAARLRSRLRKYGSAGRRGLES